MNTRLFWVGAGWAFLAAVVTWVLLTALGPVFGWGSALMGVVALLGLGYLLFLLRTGQARIGLVSSVLGWSVLAAVLCISQAGLILWILAQSACFWLLRCATRYSRVGPCLADLILSAFAIAAAAATLLHSRSAVLAVWVYFLVQALHALIPGKAGIDRMPDTTPSRFEQAAQDAELALRRLQKPR